MTETPDSVVGGRSRLDGSALDAGRLTVSAAFLGANPRPAKMFPETGFSQPTRRASREVRWGWDGASLKSASGFFVDPIGYKGGINLYEYVRNSPVNATDPTGMVLTNGQIRWLKQYKDDPKCMEDLEEIVVTASNTGGGFGSGGACGAWVDNYLSSLPQRFKGSGGNLDSGNTVVKVTPVWFKQGNPGFMAALCATVANKIGFTGTVPGHYAVRVKLPDGFVFYLDNGWEGSNGMFTFQAGHGVPTAKRPLYDEVALSPGDGHGWPGW